jgi:uncharacterized protein (UPF0332 family)
MARAREQLAASRASLASGFPPAALSLAYYAMLYAARAALSEEDAYAKTHAGTWTLFGRTFVETGRFDRALFAAPRDLLPVRLETDYEARDVTPAEARDVIELAGRFVAAIEALYPD